MESGIYGAPRFRTVLRGYDPRQVAQLFSELTDALTVARRTAAERTTELDRVRQQVAALTSELDEAAARLAVSGGERRGGDFDELGTRVGSILALAAEEAGRVRLDAEQLAAQVRRDAEAESEAIRAEAQRQAAALLASDSERHGAATDELDRVQRERAEVQADIAGLLELLDRLDAELGQAVR